jgi:undecaprenyl diphosphate synthase
MGYNRDVLHRRRDQLNEWGGIRWAGRKPRLWGSVIKELQYAEQLTRGNDTLTLTMCINYGGRHEIVDAMRAMGEQIAAGRMKPSAITEKTVRRHLCPGHARRRPVPPLERRAAHLELPAVGVGLRRDGVPRHAVADFSRTDLWHAIELYLGRSRRFGGAVDAPRRRGDGCRRE